MVDGPAPFTFEQLYSEFSDSCARAWKDDLRAVAEVVLPFGVFPGIASLINPITGDKVPVRRIGIFVITERGAATL